MKLQSCLLMTKKARLPGSAIILGFALMLGTGSAMASVIGSKHDLSSSGPGPVKAVSETQICVFCHTPHGGDQLAGAPLWNRILSTATYTPYLSSTTDANQPPGTPGASSKVCLSCHDGTMAIGVVGNLNGSKLSIANIAMNGTAGGFMPDSGTGTTRNLGIDLSNDHPISFTYDTALASNDGELRPPPVVDGTTTIVGNRSFGVIPKLPLENSQMQCSTCHDPHKSTPKFLRGNRFQADAPLGGFYVVASDIMCLACHDKDNAAASWSNSAHANIAVADEAYTDPAATEFEFPLATPVWQASCLGCHDTHTVQGARRLLREGNDSPSTPKSGGNSAIEATCFQCHRALGTSVLEPNSPPNTVPDILSDFELPIHMPISAQPETHDIGGIFDDGSGAGGGLADGTTARCNSAGDQCSKDFMESEALLGRALAGGVITNRHAECTDCHNPHRTIKNRLFNVNAVTPDEAGTHQHNIDIASPVAHSNIASGSLRGTFGVEPVYSSADFGTPGLPLTFKVKRGDPGLSVLSDVGQSYVTREYQVCLKCHSNYAYDTPDLLGYSGGTPHNTNGFDTYLNTAMEFQAPVSHMGAPASTTDSGAYSPTYSANNNRSWHPVMDSTGRTVAIRGNASPNLWRAPWNGSDTDGPTATLQVTGGAVGNQTMYCSDCHGTVTAISNGVVPDGNGSVGVWTEDGKPWGPHGSTENFILKGPSDTAANPILATTDTLCFRCHDATQYADASGSPTTVLQSGFSATGTDALSAPMSNLHQRHAYYTSTAGRLAYPSSVWPSGADNTYRCTMCHTGTAHGWKNKGFLVNLNDIGPELDKAINSTAGGALGGEIALPNPPGSVLTAGQDVPAGTQVPAGMATVPTGYSNGPYYQGALLYIANTGFNSSGNWIKTDCANSGCH